MVQIYNVVRTTNLLYRPTGVWFHCILSLLTARMLHRLGERCSFSPHSFYLISCEPLTQYLQSSCSSCDAPNSGTAFPTPCTDIFCKHAGDWLNTFGVSRYPPTCTFITSSNIVAPSHPLLTAPFQEQQFQLLQANQASSHVEAPIVLSSSWSIITYC